MNPAPPTMTNNDLTLTVLRTILDAPLGKPYNYQLPVKGEIHVYSSETPNGPCKTPSKLTRNITRQKSKMSRCAC
jgi:hypothetical protein